MKQFKASCSMIKVLLASTKKEITEKQLSEVEALENREKMTTKQLERYDSLISKRDSTEIVLSVGCKFYLKKYWGSIRNGKYVQLRTDFVSALTIGKACEPDAVKMVSEYLNIPLLKYKKVIENDFMNGSVDAIDAKSIGKAKVIHEIKTTCSQKQFTSQINRPLSQNQLYQMQGYLFLTGKEYGDMHFCLCPHPQSVIDEQKEIWYRSFEDANIPINERDARWEKIKYRLTYSHIPLNEKVLSYRIYRDDDLIKRIYKTVIACREWLYNFDKEYNSLLTKKYYE